MPLILDEEWEKNAPETVLDGRVEFVPLNFLEEIPVPGKDIYYVSVPICSHSR
jgi:hypothetical protein